jgi:hypothetical protein
LADADDVAATGQQSVIIGVNCRWFPILDTHLAQRLGFARPTKINDFIKRHLASLAKLGAIRTVRIAGQGEQAREYYLNRKQAIYITAKAETSKAIHITIEIIERFDAYEPVSGACRPTRRS